MSRATGPGRAQPGRPAASGRRWLPFWALQASEVAVAMAFADISAHVSRGTLLIVAAAVLAGLAVTARGPLGILRICGQRLHVLLVLAASAAIAVAPIVPALRPDIEGIIVVEFGAVGLIRLATLTRTTITPGGNPRRIERDQGHPGPAATRLAIDDPDWIATHTAAVPTA